MGRVVISTDEIYISATRYSSPALHGDSHWRPIRLLPAQKRGRYTATVDGRSGFIHINATGWWFEPADTVSPANAEEEESSHAS